MPGPSNIKKKRKAQAKNPKKPAAPQRLSLDSNPSTPTTCGTLGSPLTPPPHPFSEKPDPYEELVPQIPYIYDPGNGPRVRDTHAFLTSSYFAQPPALEIPLCAEFAQEEVLQMLCTVLPEETALILWYNKSRATGRICPACQRLYRLGDTLPNHVIDDEYDHTPDMPPAPQLKREQQISGLCSPVCFIIASFNYPGAIKSAWGRMEDEMDDTSWTLLNGPGAGNAQGDVSQGLGMLVKMTRLHDLGLAQLCLGEEEGYSDVDHAMDYPAGSLLTSYVMDAPT